LAFPFFFFLLSRNTFSFLFFSRQDWLGGLPASRFFFFSFFSRSFSFTIRGTPSISFFFVEFRSRPLEARDYRSGPTVLFFPRGVPLSPLHVMGRRGSSSFFSFFFPFLPLQRVRGIFKHPLRRIIRKTENFFPYLRPGGLNNCRACFLGGE